MGSQLVLGLGGNVDYEIVWDAAVLEDLVRRYDGTGRRADHVGRRGVRARPRAVGAGVRARRRGGRAVRRTPPRSLDAFADRFERRTTLGGTSVRAALAMERLGVPSTVHLVSVDDDVRRLLPGGISYVCSAERDSTDPHLIVQFPAGCRRPGRRRRRAGAAGQPAHLRQRPGQRRARARRRPRPGAQHGATSS